ncbi:MAG: hypothetical protein U5L11_17695 [Arhodomonas sp.]|nr:hypothetical protein [Arhodomonas sp.]
MATTDADGGGGEGDFLGETVEVALTDTVRERAAALDHDPVAIYHWVRNRVESGPFVGRATDRRRHAVEPARQCHGHRRPDDLVATCLRHTCRYVHGTIDVTADRFRNWAGGFSDIHAAMDYAASGGIPVTGLASGGEVTHVRMEHVSGGSQARLPPLPGAVNRRARQLGGHGAELQAV